jgi:ankyrin repeat protein
LLNRGADVNAKGGKYGTLQAAVHRGKEEIVKVLLDHEADLNVEGENPLHIALGNKNMAIAKMLPDRILLFLERE